MAGRDYPSGCRHCRMSTTDTGAVTGQFILELEPSLSRACTGEQVKMELEPLELERRQLGSYALCTLVSIMLLYKA